jgi:CMP-N,N'-diacetyllegionaminic acid synthase
VARRYGCEVPFIRPALHSTDEAPGIDPALHALQELPGYDWLVLLQPTSPLRTTADIDGAIKFCVENNAPACVTVTEASESPFWMFEIGPGGKMKQLLENRYERRQDQPNISILNGAVYVAKTDWLKKHRGFLSPETVAYSMPRERSLDIDTEKDLQILNTILPTEYQS